MVEILRNKNLATKFQILVEIAANQPDVQQKDIAKKLNITPQAISDYIMKMVEDGWVTSEGRSKHRVTREGVDWLLKALKEMQGYCVVAEKATHNVSICTAVAERDLSRGQMVRLMMKDGLLFATNYGGEGARAVAVSDARAGEDVGISSITGIVKLETGRVTIMKVPGIQRGGFRSVDLSWLKKEVEKGKLFGAIGIEALIALKQIGVEPRYFYGVREAVVEAARCGLSPVVVCVEDEVSDLLQSLKENHLEYQLLELQKTR